MQIPGTSSIRAHTKHDQTLRTVFAASARTWTADQICRDLKTEQWRTHVPATHPHGTPPLRHQQSIGVDPHLRLLATVEANERAAIERPDVGSSETHDRARRVKPEKKKTLSREESRGASPFPKHTHINSLLVYTTAPLPPLLGLHRSAYVVTNDTFLWVGHPGCLGR